MNQSRLMILLMAFVSVAVLLGAVLFQLQVNAHATWAERSLTNRWMFRDTPSRRGSISDRKGIVLREDQAGFDLEVRYRQFRRRHPVGIAYHGGLLLERLGQGVSAGTSRGEDQQFSYRDRAWLQASAQRLLDVPLTWLTEGPLEKQDAEDLAFYSISLCTQLTGLSPQLTWRRVMDVARELEPVEIAVEVDAPTVWTRVVEWTGEKERFVIPEPPLDVFAERLRELEELDAKVHLLDLQRKRSLKGAAESRRVRSLFEELDRRVAPSADWRAFELLPPEQREALRKIEFWVFLRSVLGDPEGSRWDWLDFAFDERKRLRAIYQRNGKPWLVFLKGRLQTIFELTADGEEAPVRARFEEPRRVSFEPGLGGARSRISFKNMGAFPILGPGIEIPKPLGWKVWGTLPEDRRAELTDQFKGIHGDALLALVENARGRRRGMLPWNESVSRVIQHRMPYGIAAWLGVLKESHPGLLLAPSVRRVTGPAVSGEYPGLDILIGNVSSYWEEDGAALIEKQVASTFGGGEDPLAGIMLQDAVTFGAASSNGFVGTHLDEYPDSFRETVARKAVWSIKRHFLYQGRIGRDGVEGALDDQLTGTPGLRWVVKDKAAREQKLISRLRVQPGESVRLTIDLRLQKLLERAVRRSYGSGCREAAMTILDPVSGDILAMAGYGQTGIKERGALAHGWNRAALASGGSPYLGSVAKPFVLLEHLERQRRNDSDEKFRRVVVPCGGKSKTIEGLASRFRCDHISPHSCGADPVGALGQSCNSYYYQVANGLGVAGLARAYGRVGWVQTVEPDFRYASRNQRGIAGLGVEGFTEDGTASWFSFVTSMPSKIEFLGYGKQGYRLNRGVVELTGIGYGLRVNTVMVARAYAGLATGYLPDVGLVEDPARKRTSLGVAEEDLRLVREGLRHCVREGTAHEIFAGEAGWDRIGFYAKTGTAELKPNYNAWLAGYVTGESTRTAPAFAFAAVVYRAPGHGADFAGPMVREFLRGVMADPQLDAEYLK